MMHRWLLVLSLVLAPTAQAANYHANVQDYRSKLAQLKAGDSLLLAPGTYYQGLKVHHLLGSEQNPIIIAAADPQRPAQFVARPGHNTVSILDSAHVMIKDLVLEGRNLPVGAVKAEGHANWTHHITLEGLTIRGHGANQQIVAISTKTPSWNWVVRGNTIIGAGTGMYFGNSDGSDPFVAGLIEHNLVMNTLGYNLQIKHQQPRPVLNGMPVAASETIIRHNVFSKAEGSGRPEQARPNLLVGHWPLEGTGKDDRYLIYGNFFFQNPHEALFQGEGRFALYNNIFINDHGDAIHIQPHNDIPRELSIFYNTVLSPMTGIAVRRAEGEKREFAQPVVANLVFAEMPVWAEQAYGNVTHSLVDAPKVLMAPFAPLGQLDVSPLTEAQISLAGGKERAPAFPAAELDFDQQTRRPNLAGAYGSDVGARWPLQLQRKP